MTMSSAGLDARFGVAGGERSEGVAGVGEVGVF
jgi:hypothetical protein